MPMAPSWRLMERLFAYKYKKRGACPVARSTHEGLRIAQLVETSNAESPTYVYIYIVPTIDLLTNKCQDEQRRERI